MARLEGMPQPRRAYIATNFLVTADMAVPSVNLHTSNLAPARFRSHHARVPGARFPRFHSKSVQSRVSSRVCSAVFSGPSIAVVGGGVMGLTAAVRILEALPAAQLTVVAEQVASNTTSEGAAGLWKPFAISGTPAEL